MHQKGVPPLSEISFADLDAMIQAKHQPYFERLE